MNDTSTKDIQEQQESPELACKYLFQLISTDTNIEKRRMYVYDLFYNIAKINDSKEKEHYLAMLLKYYLPDNLKIMMEKICG